jgi:hypothetical protein
VLSEAPGELGADVQGILCPFSPSHSQSVGEFSFRFRRGPCKGFSKQGGSGQAIN